jgi:hypothetical protein
MEYENEPPLRCGMRGFGGFSWWVEEKRLGATETARASPDEMEKETNEQTNNRVALIFETRWLDIFSLPICWVQNESPGLEGLEMPFSGMKEWDQP